MSSSPNQKSPVTFPEADDKHDMPLLSEDSTDNPFHRQLQSSTTSDQNISETPTHIAPDESLQEAALPITEHSRTTHKPISDAAQNSHLNSTSVSAPLPKKASKTASPQNSSRTEDVSSHTVNKHHKQHRPHLQELTMDDNRHKKFHEDQFTSKTSVVTEPHREYLDKASPQEESWVKQLFVAREKSIAQGEGPQRRQQNNGEFDKKHFASNTAKFTKMLEEPLTGETGKTGLSTYKQPKAGLY